MDLDIFQFKKLTITSYDDVARKTQYKQPIEVMFNPSTYSLTHSIAWGQQQGTGTIGAELSYRYSEPSELALDLVVDGTGVDEMGLFGFTKKTVTERVKALLDITYHLVGKTHQPGFLHVTWGDALDFKGCLSSVTIKYTSFDRQGHPLRAELAVKLISDDEAKKLSAKDVKSSPDLSHVRLVRSGDTLPLLTKEIYGSSARYLDVARFNRLDEIRELEPGRQIVFPPLARLDAMGTGKG